MKTYDQTQTGTQMFMTALFIVNGQVTETAQMPFNRWTGR